MAKPVKSKHTPGGDFLAHFESAQVCFESGTLKNGSGVDLEGLDMIGQPLKTVGANYEPALEIDSAAGITGWLLESGRLTLANGETLDRKVLVLARGPAAINKLQIPSTDVAGTPFTEANLIAAAEAVNIQIMDEPPETSIQQT